jgi:hypothetical protein
MQYGINLLFLIIVSLITVFNVSFSDRWREEVNNLPLAKEAHKENIILQNIIPICSICKKIRNDRGYWMKMKINSCEHSDLLFSHTICPECAEKYYPDYIPDNKVRIK